MLPHSKKGKKIIVVKNRNNLIVDLLKLYIQNKYNNSL